MSITSKTYITFKLGLGALVGVASLMATPPYRLFALATLPMLILAARSLPKPNRRLLFSAYVLLGLCGLAIGHFFWHGDRLNDVGLKLMIFLLLPVTIGAALRTLLSRSGEA